MGMGSGSTWVLGNFDAGFARFFRARKQKDILGRFAKAM